VRKADQVAVDADNDRRPIRYRDLVERNAAGVASKEHCEVPPDSEHGNDAGARSPMQSLPFAARALFTSRI
jgi:hypothetical protein